MELLESLIVNKKNFIILASIYVIIVIAILVWIWWPEKTYEVGTYEPYNESAVNSKMLEYYVNFLENMKTYASRDAYEDYIDYGYLQYTNSTIDDVMSMLSATDSIYVLGDYTVYDNNGKNIYSVTLPKGNDKLQVNIIEKSYPYNFRITFGTFVNYSEASEYGSIKGARLKITGVHQDLNYIEYELTVTNNEYDTLTLDLTNADNFVLKLDNGSSVDLNILQAVQDKLTVEKGMTAVIKLAFKVGIAEQDNISSLSISKISNGTSEFNTTISL